MSADLLQLTPAGLYCPAGDFYIDPWQPVDRAVITHARGPRPPRLAALSHQPHRRTGCWRRVDAGAHIRPALWRNRSIVNGVTGVLHPAGHLLGSAQVRVAHRDEIWVVSGDYKVERRPVA
ncbi:MAG: hypothetical protein R2838_22020 [Caldilineaceae bacterium]